MKPDFAIKALVLEGASRILRYDPWSLTRAERAELRQTLAEEQDLWARRLEPLTPPHAGEIPWFLLATRSFRTLRQLLGDPHSREPLAEATRARVLGFARSFADYLAAA